ncbi:hypothetical protein AB205_0109420, partial [Aquarana catesbeiana]
VVYTAYNTGCAVSNTLLVVYTVYIIQCSHCTLSNTVQAVYTVSNTVCTVSNTLQAACTQYIIQCSAVLQKKHHVWKATKERQTLTGHTKRGQAASASTVNSGGRGHGASSAGGHGARLSFFSAAGRVIEPQHAEELVEWITKLSSSSVTQAQSSLPSSAAAKVAYSTGSLSTVTPSVAPPSCTEVSPELFDHSVGYMLLEDAQQFEGSDVGFQVEEGSNVSLERGGATEGQETGSHVPPAAAYCQVYSSDEEGGDDKVTDSTWVPERREEESEEEAQLTAELRRCRVLLTPR